MHFYDRQMCIIVAYINNRTPRIIIASGHLVPRSLTEALLPYAICWEKVSVKGGGGGGGYGRDTCFMLLAEQLMNNKIHTV